MTISEAFIYQNTARMSDLIFLISQTEYLTHVLSRIMDILDDSLTKPVPSPLSIRPSQGCLRIPGTTPIEERTRFKRRPNRRTHRRSRSLGSLNFGGRKRKANRIGFDAFRVEHTRVCGRGMTVVGTEIVSPDQGIHVEFPDRLVIPV